MHRLRLHKHTAYPILLLLVGVACRGNDNTPKNDDRAVSPHPGGSSDVRFNVAPLGALSFSGIEGDDVRLRARLTDGLDEPITECPQEDLKLGLFTNNIAAAQEAKATLARSALERAYTWTSTAGTDEAWISVTFPKARTVDGIAFDTISKSGICGVYADRTLTQVRVEVLNESTGQWTSLAVPEEVDGDFGIDFDPLTTRHIRIRPETDEALIFEWKIFSPVKLDACISRIACSAGTCVDHRLTQPGPCLIVKDSQSEPTCPPGSPCDVGQWSPVAGWPFLPIHVSLLPTGKVLAWDRLDVAGEEHPPALFDPTNDSIEATDHVYKDIFCAGHTLLPDGRLFLAGGHRADYLGLDIAHMFNPFTKNWYPIQAPMNGGRWYPTATVLPDGNVLVHSGSTESAAEINLEPQIFETRSAMSDAATNPWRDLPDARWPTDRLGTLDMYPRMHVAPQDGLVFNSGPGPMTAYIDVRGAGEWIEVGRTNVDVMRTYGSSVEYAPGQILIVGGGGDRLDGELPTDTAEVIDLNQEDPKWRQIASMSDRRRYHNATLLPDGTVLITGGTRSPGFNNGASPVFEAELWDPKTETFRLLSSSATPRLYHSVALLLPDGRVLTGSGGHPVAAGHENQANIEIYSPPYLFQGARPKILSADAQVDVGGTIQIKSDHPDTIRQINLLRPGSVTHSMDQSQKIIPLSFERTTDTLVAQVPSNQNIAIPGQYMLFILNEKGVPSVGQWINVGTIEAPPEDGPPNPKPPPPALVDIRYSFEGNGWFEGRVDPEGLNLEQGEKIAVYLRTGSPDNQYYAQWNPSQPATVGAVDENGIFFKTGLREPPKDIMGRIVLARYTGSISDVPLNPLLIPEADILVECEPFHLEDLGEFADEHNDRNHSCTLTEGPPPNRSSDGLGIHVDTLNDEGYWYTFEGRVLNLPDTRTYRLVPYVHVQGDLYYQADVDNTASGFKDTVDQESQTYVLRVGRSENNSEPLTVMLVAEDQDPTTLCTHGALQRACAGSIDPTTGHALPYALSDDVVGFGICTAGQDGRLLCENNISPSLPDAPTEESRVLEFLLGLRSDAGLVRSEPGNFRGHLESNALAAVAFVHGGAIDAARTILEIISPFQFENGSFPDLFQAEATPPHPLLFRARLPSDPVDQSFYRDRLAYQGPVNSGNNAEFLLALAHYQRQTGDNRFQGTMLKLADYLVNVAQKKDASLGTYGGIVAQPTANEDSPHRHMYLAKHQAKTFAALELVRTLMQHTGQPELALGYAEATHLIFGFAQKKLYNSEGQYYLGAIHDDTNPEGAPTAAELAHPPMDAQTLSFLAFKDRAFEEGYALDLSPVLDYAWANLRGKTGLVNGQSRVGTQWFVGDPGGIWLEGMAQFGLALGVSNGEDHHARGEEIYGLMTPMEEPDGGFQLFGEGYQVHADVGEEPGRSTVANVVPTAWRLLDIIGINPLSVRLR